MTRTGWQDVHDRQVADDYLSDHGKCHKCGAWTPNLTLANLGAQCHNCFSAYCAELDTGAAPRTAEERRAVIQRLQLSAGGVTMRHAERVAKRLREIDASGRKLTESQRSVLASCEAKLQGQERLA
jgi:hypothetical protein